MSARVALAVLLGFAAVRARAAPILGEGPEDPERQARFGFERRSKVPGSYTIPGSSIPVHWVKATDEVTPLFLKQGPPARRRPDYLPCTHVDLTASPREKERRRAPPDASEAFADRGTRCVHLLLRGTLRAGAKVRDLPEDGVAIYRDPPYRLVAHHDYKLRGLIRVRVPDASRLPPIDHKDTRGKAHLGVTYLRRKPGGRAGVYERWDGKARKFKILTERDPKTDKLIWRLLAAVPNAVSQSVPLKRGDSGWQEVELRLNPPHGTTHVRVICEAYGTEPYADIWFDSLELLLRPTIRILTWQDIGANKPRPFHVFRPGDRTGVEATVELRGLGEPKEDDYTLEMYLVDPLAPRKRYYIVRDKLHRTVTSDQPARWPVPVGSDAKGRFGFEFSLPLGSPGGPPAYGSFLLHVDLFRQGLPSGTTRTRMVNLAPVRRIRRKPSAVPQGIGVEVSSHEWDVELLHQWLLRSVHSNWLAVPMWRRDFRKGTRLTGEDRLYRTLLTLVLRSVAGSRVQVTGGFYPLPAWLRAETRRPEGGAPLGTMLDVLGRPPGDKIPWPDAVRPVLGQYASVTRDFLLGGETGRLDPDTMRAFRGLLREFHRGPLTFPLPAGAERPQGMTDRDRVAWRISARPPDAKPGARDLPGALTLRLPPPGEGDMLLIELPPRAPDNPARELERVEHLWKTVVLGRSRGFKRFLVTGADRVGPGQAGIVGLGGSAGEGERVDTGPDLAFVAIRTLNDMLAGAEPSPDTLFLPDAESVENRIFVQRTTSAGGRIEERAVIVFWASQAQDLDTAVPFSVLLDLADDARMVDLFGNPVPIRRAGRAADGPAPLRQTATRLPRFLTGLKGHFLKLMLNLRTTRKIESRWRAQRVEVLLPHHFRQKRAFRVTAELL